MANNADMFTLRPEYANSCDVFTFPEDYIAETKKLDSEQTEVLDLLTDDISNKMIAPLVQETFSKLSVPAQLQPIFQKMSGRAIDYLEASKLSVQDQDRKGQLLDTDKSTPRLISIIQNNKLYRYKMVQVIHTLNELQRQGMIPAVASDQKGVSAATLLFTARSLYNQVTAAALHVIKPILEKADKEMPEALRSQLKPLSKEETEAAITRIAASFEKAQKKLQLIVKQ